MERLAPPRLISDDASASGLVRQLQFQATPFPWLGDVGLCGGYRKRLISVSDFRRAMNSRSRARKKRLAEPADRRLGLEIKRAANHIAVELVWNDRKPEIGNQSCSSFFDRRNFSGKSGRLGLLGGDGKEQHQIAIEPGNSNTDRDRPIFPVFGFAFAVFPRPKIRIANDRCGLVGSYSYMTSQLRPSTLLCGASGAKSPAQDKRPGSRRGG